jgi:hypothetical protein
MLGEATGTDMARLAAEGCPILVSWVTAAFDLEQWMRVAGA